MLPAKYPRSVSRRPETASPATPDWFQLHDSEGNSVLGSPTFLAKELSRKGHFGYKGVATLATVLTLVFNQKRNCPERLVHPLQSLVESRLAALPPEEAEPLAKEFRGFLTERVLDGFRAEVQSLLSEVRKCESFFGIIPEGVGNTECGHIVLDAIIARALAAHESGTSVRVVMCFPDPSLAIGFLDAVLLKLSRGSGDPARMDEAKRLLRDLERSGAFQIRVLPNPNELTFFPPMVVVNPDEGDRCSGYNLYLFSDTTPEISRMHNAVARQAIDSIYKPLLTRRISTVRKIDADGILESA